MSDSREGDEDPRPVYRILATPWYDHEPTSRPEHMDGAGHDHDCAAGHTLEVYVRNPGQPPPLGMWRTIGMTQTNSRGTLDLHEATHMAMDYVATLTLPLQSGITADRIEVYVRMEP